MKPAAHIAASAVISGSVYCATRSVTVAAVSFFCGFLTDVDHVIDYIREYGFRTNAKEFFRIFHETRFRKLLLVFHAWEWVLCLLLLAWLTGWNEFILGMFIGVFQHLLLDQFSNGVTPGGYFIIHRAVKRFSVNELVREEVLRSKRGDAANG